MSQVTHHSQYSSDPIQCFINSVTDTFSLNRLWSHAFFEYLCGMSSVECSNCLPYVLQAVIFDEIDLIDLSFAECSIKNVNHCFQVRPVPMNTLCPSIAVHQVVQLTSLRLYELGSWLLSCCPQWAAVVAILIAWPIFIKCQCYPISLCVTPVLFNFLQWAVTIWRTYETVGRKHR